MTDIGHDGILIGEGVVLDARPASFMTRSLGVLLDLTVTYIALTVVITVFDEVFWRMSYNWWVAAMITLMVIFMVGVPATVETLSRGRSLGKLCTGVRVVRSDGGPVRFRHALIRALVGVFEIWLTAGSVALITSLFNAKGRRLGDMVAGTYVIRVRGGKGFNTPLFMPPPLAVWASTADMRRLPDGLALVARNFLNRGPKLTPASRIALANDLAARVEPYVAPAPPFGTPPEDFLFAVLHERRDRELAGAMRKQVRVAQQGAALQRLPFGIMDAEVVR